MEAVIDRPPPTGEGLTFEKVWAMFQETREQMKETDRKLQRNEQMIEDLGRQMGGLHNSFGELAEHLVAPGIARRFNELGYHFNIEVMKGFTITEQGRTKAEIDILLVNGECIIAVEVKSRIHVKKKPEEQDDIDHHIRRLEILRKFWPTDQRKIHGAIAGAIFDKDAKEAALQAGFFVLEQSRDTMKMDIPEGFVPKEW